MSRALLPFQVQRNKMERGEYDHVAPDPNLVTIKTEEVWVDDDGLLRKYMQLCNCNLQLFCNYFLIGSRG